VKVHGKAIIKEGQRELRCLPWRARQGALNGTVSSSGKDVGSSKNKVELIREYGYHVVPLPGVEWEAVRKEMGAPQDVRLAIENWVERRWARVGKK
jgi:hypothetical protein